MISGEKGQVMLEYIILMGVALAILTLVIYISNSLIAGSKTEMSVNTAKSSVNTMKQKAEWVYLKGHPSKTETKIRIPSNTLNFTVEQHLIHLKLDISPSHTDIYVWTPANLTPTNLCTGNDCAGTTPVLVFTSTLDDKVNITVK